MNGIHKTWLWDYDTVNIFASPERNRAFALTRIALYGSDADVLAQDWADAPSLALPTEYIAFLSALSRARETRPMTILTPSQQGFIAALIRTDWAQEVWFTGGTALSEHYLQHRLSEDLDFFSSEELPLEAIEHFAIRAAQENDLPQPAARRVFNRTIVTFGDVLKAEIVHMPFENVEAPKRIGGLRVDSLTDIGVNKVHALLQRGEPKDFVDLYFIARLHKSMPDLFALARAKFEMAYRLTDLGAALRRADDIAALPRMLRPLTPEELIAFFREVSEHLFKLSGR